MKLWAKYPFCTEKLFRQIFLGIKTLEFLLYSSAWRDCSYEFFWPQ